MSLLGAATASAQDFLPEQAPAVQHLRSLAVQLGSDDETQRQAAFDELTTLEADQLPAIRARIERLRRGRPPRNWANDIMNRFRRHSPTEEGQPPDIARGALVELGREHPVAREHARVLLMAEPALYWHALDRMGTLEAHRAVFPLIGLDEGLWMPEARNWLRERGPALMAASMYARSDGNRFTRRWGRWGMETLDAENPGRAIHTVDETQLPDLLLAYAEQRIQGAMRVVISYVDSERRAVRLAAREAMQIYGGNGIWVLRTAYRNEIGERPDEDIGWRGLSAALYAHIDDRRMERVRTALSEGIAARDDDDLDTMRTSFDSVLARMPELEEPGPVAEGYAALARRAASDEAWNDAEWAYRRALRLDADHASAGTWRTELAFAAARRGADDGVWDERAFERVLAASPDHRGALEALEALEAPAVRAAQADSTRTRWGIAAALLIALLGLGLLWRNPDRDSFDLGEETTLGDTLDETADTTLSESTLSG